MRRRPMPPVREGTVNVTPLIDIVMCMIIFFMLVAKIGVNTGSDTTIKVPDSLLGRDLSDFNNTLYLNVRAGPTTPQGPEPLITALVAGQMTELHLRSGGDNLVDTLKYLRQGDPSRNLPPNANFGVIIRGEADMTYQYLAPVLLACTEAGVRNVSFVTNKIERPE